MLSVLEINDLAVSLTDSSGELRYNEPAAIAWHEQQFRYGHDALAISRVLPQQFNQRYLSPPNAQPLAAALGSAQNHADLIYQHLGQLPLNDGESVLVAVPAHWTNEQLGLLLGVCEELKVSVAGFADIALSHALDLPGREQVAVLDIEQHRLVLTHCQRQGDQLQVRDHRVWEGRGFNHLFEGWLSLIADEFVQRTRFDPLHSGAAEQQLLDQVSGWTQGGNAHNLRLHIERGGEPHELEIQAELLLEKLQQRMAGIELPDEIALTHRVQGVPGLTAWLDRQCSNVALLADSSGVQRNYELIQQHLVADSVARIMAATVSVDQAHSASPGEPSTRPSADRSLPPVTHLLAANIAYPIQRLGLSSSRQGMVFPATAPAEVNGQPVAGPVDLIPGDQVSLGEQHYLAIAIED